MPWPEICLRLIDFDGCLANYRFIDDQDRNIIRANQRFFDYLKEENKKYARVILGIGSNRQSYQDDRYNSTQYDGDDEPIKIGSCFPQFKRISEYLENEFCNLLMPDLYEDLSIGTSYERAIDPEFKGAHGSWVFDLSKASMLYAQIHHMASQNPRTNITVDFYDDTVDILKALSDFYVQQSLLIPQNVTLNLHHYNGARVTYFNSILGTGMIDVNYKETVKEMSRICLASGQVSVPGCICTTSHVTEGRLRQRQAWVSLTLSDDTALSDSESEDETERSSQSTQSSSFTQALQFQSMYSPSRVTLDIPPTEGDEHRSKLGL